MNETTENFWEVWNSFEWPEPPKIFFRLYHDDQGRLLFYSMEDLPGNYIDIDAETFALSPANVRVVNGQLTYVDTTTYNKLVPGAQGTPCAPDNVCIVVDPDQPNTRWSLSQK
jgi:hypothetical protein